MSWRRGVRSNPRHSWAWSPTCCMRGGEFTDVKKHSISYTSLHFRLGGKSLTDLTWIPCLRFGPYYIEPVIAGLDPKTFEPFICSLDLIGCPMVTEDFVVSGTCSEQMYGMCESLWEPDMVGCELYCKIIHWVIVDYLCLYLQWLFLTPAGTRGPVWDHLPSHAECSGQGCRFRHGCHCASHVSTVILFLFHCLHFGWNTCQMCN